PQRHGGARARSDGAFVNADVGVLERASYIQRGAQGEDAQRFVLRVDVQIQFFGGQVDIAGDVYGGVLGVQLEHPCAHEAVLHLKVGRQAIEHDLLIAEQLDDDHVGDVQACGLQNEVADGSLGDDAL